MKSALNDKTISRILPFLLGILIWPCIGQRNLQAQNNVGINISTPLFPLDVRGTSDDFGGVMQVATPGQTNYLRFFSGNTNDRHPILAFHDLDTFHIVTTLPDWSTYTRRFTVLPSGQVGIGTDIPLSKLDVAAFGDGAEVIRLSTDRPWVFKQLETGPATRLALQTTVNSKSFQILSEDGTNRVADFFANNTHSNILLVPDNGEVAIGQVFNENPTARLHIAHNSNIGWPQLRLTEIGYDFARLKMETDSDPGTFWDIAARSDSIPANARLNFFFSSPNGSGDRMSISGNGNVGIGTTNPTETLHVNGTMRVSDLAGSGDRNVIVDGNGKFKIGVTGSGDTDWIETADEVYNLDHNIGIGTSSPGARLQILGFGASGAFKITFPGSPPFYTDAQSMIFDSDEINVEGTIFNDLKIMSQSTGNIKLVGGGGNVGVGFDQSDNPASVLTVKGPENDGVDAPFRIYTTNSDVPLLIDDNEIDCLNSTTGLRINANTENPVSIGTYTPASGYMLSVGGKIIAEEVRVQLEADWPDYVFEQDYPLMPLDELALAIREHGHLPGIPEAHQLEENGLDVGDMQRRMMEKIEELTLYILQQDEQIRKLTHKIEALESNSR